MNNIPQDLRYADSHEWVRLEADGTATVGITDHAQAELTDIVFAEPPKIGASFVAGDVAAVVESVKAASDIYAPVAGKVVAANEALSGDPALVNKDCYGAGWMIRIAPTDPAEWNALLDAAAYEKEAGKE